MALARTIRGGKTRVVVGGGTIGRSSPQTQWSTGSMPRDAGEPLRAPRPTPQRRGARVVLFGRTPVRPEQGPALPQSLPRSTLRSRSAHTWRGTEMARGTVKWFNDDRGCGLITPDEPGKDVLGTPQQGTERHGLKRQEEDHDGKAHP